MERIDRYVNSICRHVGGNKVKIETLKEEMKNHLLQMVEELKSQGNTEDESISIALENFGDETQIENELLDTFKFENKIAKVALFTALIFFLIAIISAAAYIFKTNII